MAKYVGYKVEIPIDVWDEIVKIAYDDWDIEDKRVAIKISPPGIKAQPPKSETITKLLRKALRHRGV